MNKYNKKSINVKEEQLKFKEQKRIKIVKLNNINIKMKII